MILTPDFIDHAWHPLVGVARDGDFLVCRWQDGLEFRAYVLWLAENAQGMGLDVQTRESTLSPAAFEGVQLDTCGIDDRGALTLSWANGKTSSVHPGWLRYVAEGQHEPSAPLPRSTAWEFAQPPVTRGDPSDPEVLAAWISDLIRFGVGCLAEVGDDETAFTDVMRLIGPIRGSNFGDVFTVAAKPSPDSTAYTGLALGQHSDLPTRETPPGFQFLHCLENRVVGGEARLTDGMALIEALAEEAPEVLRSLVTDEWIFINRAEDAEHRFKAPIVELPKAGRPLTFRAFYPVRSAPAMAERRIADAYEALRVLQTYAEDERFCITFAYKPGDLIGFDNRRVLHGRAAFSSTGARKLVGCYMDRDDVLSRLRVLNRPRS